MPAQTPVGQWQSPITSELITSKSIGLGAVKAAPDGLIYWLEARPTEGGRSVLVRRYACTRSSCPACSLLVGADDAVFVLHHMHQVMEPMP